MTVYWGRSPTIPPILANAAWHTEAIGRMHFGGRRLGLPRHQSQEECVHHAGDDDYLSSLLRAGVRTRYPHGIRGLLAYQPQTSGIAAEHAPPAWIARRACRFMEAQRQPRERPFFLWCSWIQPHLPFAPPAPWDALHSPERQSLPLAAGRALDTLPSGFWRQRGRMRGAHLDAPRIRRIRALYGGLVSQVDAAVGQVLECLERLGLAETTVVIFTADHGEMLGDHGLSRKGCPYEAAVRVPLLLRWPGRTEAGRVCPDRVSLTDLLPTLLAELGLPYSGTRPLEGANLLGTPGGGLAGPRDAVFVEFGHGRRRWVSTRTHRYAYVRHAEGIARGAVRPSGRPGRRRGPQYRRTAGDRRAERPRAGLGAGEWPAGLLCRPLERPARRARGAARDRPAKRSCSTRAGCTRTCRRSGTAASSRTRRRSPAPSPRRAPSLPNSSTSSFYKRLGGHPLTGTSWEDAWRKA